MAKHYGLKPQSRFRMLYQENSDLNSCIASSRGDIMFQTCSKYASWHVPNMPAYSQEFKRCKSPEYVHRQCCNWAGHVSTVEVPEPKTRQLTDRLICRTSHQRWHTWFLSVIKNIISLSSLYTFRNAVETTRSVTRKNQNLSACVCMYVSACVTF